MTRFERWAVWISSVLTALTGGVYYWMKYLLTPANPWAVVNHPWQPAVLKAHILVAPVLVFAVGLIFTRHIWRHVTGNVRMGRRSGLLTTLVLAPMIVSGYLIQSVTDEGWLRGVALAHLATSALYVLGLALHQVVVRRERGRAGMTRTSRRIRGRGHRSPAGRLTAASRT